jgi:hypothetical protein
MPLGADARPLIGAALSAYRGRCSSNSQGRSNHNNRSAYLIKFTRVWLVIVDIQTTMLSDVLIVSKFDRARGTKIVICKRGFLLK